MNPQPLHTRKHADARYIQYVLDHSNTLQEAARIAGIDESTLYRWRRTHKLRWLKPLPGERRTFPTLPPDMREVLVAPLVSTPLDQWYLAPYSQPGQQWTCTISWTFHTH